MFYNDIRQEYDEDISDSEEREKIFDLYYEKDKQFRINSKLHEIVGRIVIWLKYYRMENIDFNTLIRSFLDDFTLNLTSKELLLLENNVKKLLEKEFKIKIISKKPMVLESPVPFDKLNEKKTIFYWTNY